MCYGFQVANVLFYRVMENTHSDTTGMQASIPSSNSRKCSFLKSRLQMHCGAIPVGAGGNP